LDILNELNGLLINCQLFLFKNQKNCFLFERRYQQQFDLFIRNLNFPKLSDEDRDEIEDPLTLEECKTFLESFQENKLPGEDGFTIEFYKYFFDSIEGHVLENGELSISQRRGIITLTPKDESDLVDLQNRRPITLLNTDYKIASKALARRIETILPN